MHGLPEWLGMAHALDQRGQLCFFNTLILAQSEVDLVFGGAHREQNLSLFAARLVVYLH